MRPLAVGAAFLPLTPQAVSIGDLILGAAESSRSFEGEISRVAASDVTVLLEGESGSGKSVTARALHARSARSAGPLVEVPLAALAPSLIEAELFGHSEGAFTGAQRARVGRFLQAQGGTLVLDGVEGLPLELQVKLLRVLQERVVEPLGADEALPVDVRVIATSAHDLRLAVEEQRFREDLYYRLAVVVLRVPPLRSRLEDLPVLCEPLIRRVAKRVGLPPRGLSEAALGAAG